MQTHTAPQQYRIALHKIQGRRLLKSLGKSPEPADYALAYPDFIFILERTQFLDVPILKFADGLTILRTTRA